MKHTKIALCSVAALFVAGQAFAHTGVRDVVAEGAGSYNAFTLTHGCAAAVGYGTQQQYPVLGQSAAFPYGVNAVWRNADGSIIPADQDADGNDRNNGAGTIAADFLNLGVAGIAGFSSSFITANEIAIPSDIDPALRVVQGLIWKDGAMAPNMYNNMPFRVGAPVIEDHCVSTLNVRVAVINYCDIGKNEANDAAGPYKKPKDAFGRKVPMTNIVGAQQTNVTGATPYFDDMDGGNGGGNRADWWFAALEGGSALYNDPAILQPTYWATMKVVNSAVDTALCPGGEADLKEVSVEPNGLLVDTVLSGPNTRPFSKGNTDL